MARNADQIEEIVSNLAREVRNTAIDTCAVLAQSLALKGCTPDELAAELYKLKTPAPASADPDQS